MNAGRERPSDEDFSSGARSVEPKLGCHRARTLRKNAASIFTKKLVQRLSGHPRSSREGRMISASRRPTSSHPQDAGVVVLAVSFAYSALDLLGWLRPILLRWRADGGVRHTLAVVLGSLTFKALVLIVNPARVLARLERSLH